MLLSRAPQAAVAMCSRSGGPASDPGSRLLHPGPTQWWMGEDPGADSTGARLSGGLRPVLGSPPCRPSCSDSLLSSPEGCTVTFRLLGMASPVLP